jgi:hypothetical protein
MTLNEGVRDNSASVHAATGLTTDAAQITRHIFNLGIAPVPVACAIGFVLIGLGLGSMVAFAWLGRQRRLPRHRRRRAWHPAQGPLRAFGISTVEVHRSDAPSPTNGGYGRPSIQRPSTDRRLASEPSYAPPPGQGTGP